MKKKLAKKRLLFQLISLKVMMNKLTIKIVLIWNKPQTIISFDDYPNKKLQIKWWVF